MVVMLKSPYLTLYHLKQIKPFRHAGKYDYDLVVIGGGSGGLACSKEGEFVVIHHRLLNTIVTGDESHVALVIM